jgi:hypothetical protein
VHCWRIKLFSGYSKYYCTWYKIEGTVAYSLTTLIQSHLVPLPKLRCGVILHVRAVDNLMGLALIGIVSSKHHSGG